eukprot:scaffold108120_cov19-Tisochrysis_lutea.AAC.1
MPPPCRTQESQLPESNTNVFGRASPASDLKSPVELPLWLQAQLGLPMHEADTASIFTKKFSISFASAVAFECEAVRAIQEWPGARCVLRKHAQGGFSSSASRKEERPVKGLGPQTQCLGDLTTQRQSQCMQVAMGTCWYLLSVGSHHVVQVIDEEHRPATGVRSGCSD